MFQGFEQYCKLGMVGTYNGKEKFPHMAEYTPDGGNPTYGGYSDAIVVNKAFVLKVSPEGGSIFRHILPAHPYTPLPPPPPQVPKNLDLAAATPLLCAGITTYSPLKVPYVAPM